MYKALVRICSTRALIPFISLSLALFSSLNVTAQETINADNSSPLQVKYVGGDNEALYFTVKYDNKTGGAFKVLALDETTGETLFQDNYSSKELDKKFKIPRLTDTDYVTFLIRSAKENIQFIYKVKVTTKVVDETVFLKNRELVSYK